MGLGIALRGSGALWEGSMALGRDAGLALVYPELAPSRTSTYLSTYLSIPEVPTPLGLLSSLRGIAVSPV